MSTLQRLYANQGYFSNELDPIDRVVAVCIHDQFVSLQTIFIFWYCEFLHLMSTVIESHGRASNERLESSMSHSHIGSFW